MNTRKSILALATGVLLAVSGIAVAGAPQKSAPKAAKTAAKTVDSVTRGTILSADANMVVLADKKNAKAPGMSFKLNAQTAKAGDMAPGTAVTVHYRKDGSDMIATSVVGAAPKAAAKAAKSPAKK